MSRLTAIVTDEERARILDLADRWGMTLSDAIRAIAIQGVGGSFAEAIEVNDWMAVRADRARKAGKGGFMPLPAGKKPNRGIGIRIETPPDHRRRRGQREGLPYEITRFSWSRAIRAFGGLGAALRAGLASP